MKNQIAEGHQIYVVYPLIKESEKMDLINLQEGYEAMMRDFPEPDYHISVVHGQMKAEDKDWEMQRFVRGETHIMIATTVIEVGVNVPNASVMIIENANRFGLSQLHQLRGRVGRGAEQSYCVLITDHKITGEGKKRMETMDENRRLPIRRAYHQAHQKDGEPASRCRPDAVKARALRHKAIFHSAIRTRLRLEQNRVIYFLFNLSQITQISTEIYNKNP